MIGSLSYEEMSNLANSLATSSSKIREVIGKYNSDKYRKNGDVIFRSKFIDKMPHAGFINSARIYNVNRVYNLGGESFAQNNKILVGICSFYG